MAHIGKKKQIQSLGEAIKGVCDEAYRNIKPNREAPERLEASTLKMLLSS